MISNKITDRSGHSFNVWDIENHYYPRFPLDSVINVFAIKARPDDILLCTYPKSGTHWTWEIMRLLLAGTTEVPLKDKSCTMIEARDPSSLEEVSSPRLLNTHVHCEKMSPQFFKQKCKIVYVTRDPRDVAGSYFNHFKKLKKFYHYDGEWNDFFHLYLEGQVEYNSWFDYTKGWEKWMKENPDYPFLVMSYEAMKEDPLREVKRVAVFLGVERSEDFLKEVVKKTSFCAMKAIRNAEDGYTQAMYNKGMVGDWTNRFTVAQSELYNEAFEKEMVGTDAYKLYSHTVQRKSDAIKKDA